MSSSCPGAIEDAVSMRGAETWGADAVGRATFGVGGTSGGSGSFGGSRRVWSGGASSRASRTKSMIG